MKNISLILLGAGIFVLGVVLNSPLVDWLVSILAWLMMFVGGTVFIYGIFSKVVRRK